MERLTGEKMAPLEWAKKMGVSDILKFPMMRFEPNTSIALNTMLDNHSMENLKLMCGGLIIYIKC